MESMIRFNAQTTGRDKLFRLCQYISRLIWAILEKYKPNKDSINKLKDLENTLSTSRKLLRMGRCVDVMHSAMQTIHLPDSTLRITLTFSRIASSLYLLCDHMLWLGKIGFINVNKNEWSKWSNKFWLYSITMNLIRDLYEIKNILKLSNTSNLTQKHYFGHSSRVNAMPSHASNTSIISETGITKSMELIIKHKNVCIDTLKNFCDFWIPLSSLGHIKLSPSMVGLLGSLSSLIAILQILDYAYRLSPS